MLSGFVFLPVGPKLKPFESTLHILSGDTISIACIAKEGDTPISFLWTKDGVPANSLYGVDIVRSSKSSSVLSVAEAGSNHSGMYSCTAFNSAGVAKTSVQLEIHGSVCALE